MTLRGFAQVDHMVFQSDEAFYLKNDALKGMAKLWDLAWFLQISNLIWFHQVPMREHFESLGKTRKWVYILRDGRSVINSSFHFVTTGTMVHRYPKYTLSSIDEIYDVSNIHIFKKYLDR